MISPVQTLLPAIKVLHSSRVVCDPHPFQVCSASTASTSSSPHPENNRRKKSSTKSSRFKNDVLNWNITLNSYKVINTLPDQNRRHKNSCCPLLLLPSHHFQHWDQGIVSGHSGEAYLGWSPAKPGLHYSFMQTSMSCDILSLSQYRLQSTVYFYILLELNR